MYGQYAWRKPEYWPQPSMYTEYDPAQPMPMPMPMPQPMVTMMPMPVQPWQQWQPPHDAEDPAGVASGFDVLCRALKASMTSRARTHGKQGKVFPFAGIARARAIKAATTTDPPFSFEDPEALLRGEAPRAARGVLARVREAAGFLKQQFARQLRPPVAASATGGLEVLEVMLAYYEQMFETDEEVSFAEDEEDAAQEPKQLAAEVLRTLKASQQVLKRYAAVYAAAPPAVRKSTEAKMPAATMELVKEVRSLFLLLKEEELTAAAPGTLTARTDAKNAWNDAVRLT
jgi:hypothetical protein